MANRGFRQRTTLLYIYLEIATLGIIYVVIGAFRQKYQCMAFDNDLRLQENGKRTKFVGFWKN